MTMVTVRGLPPGVVDGVLGSVEVAPPDAGGSVEVPPPDVGGSVGGSVSGSVAGELDDASEERASDDVRAGGGSAVSVDELHPASATAATKAASHWILRGGRPTERPRTKGAGRLSSVIEVKHRIHGASVTRRLRPGR
ncbi:MAG TPA: hypothetical protein VES21_10475 [Nocardioidaceae bacterium]|nr:hypothetical protein [Nocardioidaceae bacterium]